MIERVAAPEHSPPDQQGATCILVLGHVLAKSRQHREVRTSLGEVCGYWNDEIALVDGIEDFDGADDLAVCERRAL